MRAPRLRIVSVGPPDPPPALLHELSAALERELGLEVLRGEPLVASPTWRLPGSGQLASGQAVDALEERHPASAGEHDREWVLGVTAADLVAEGREFVFGEATLGGCWAVVSTARLEPGDPARLLPRLVKESAHELGHLRGLEHCPDTACVMAPSSGVAGVDRKRAALCAACRARAEAPRDP